MLFGILPAVSYLEKLSHHKGSEASTFLPGLGSLGCVPCPYSSALVSRIAELSLLSDLLQVGEGEQSVGFYF